MDTNGVITGTPTATGTYQFVLKVTNSDGLSASRTISLTVNPPSGPTAGALAINTSSLPDAKVNTAYAAQLNATGGTLPYHWTATQLPAGLGLDAGTGLISGTALGAGDFTFTVTVTDNAAASVSTDFTLTITP